MAYISRSGDFPKVKMERWVAYIIRSHDQISFFGNFDGLYKQAFFCFKCYKYRKIPKNSKKYPKIS
jgi:hypothetical protein